MILGITGGSGCGKTTLLQAVEQVGGLVLDCDAIYHRLLQEDTALLAAIGNRFPGTVTGGVLDRKKLGGLVFADPASLADLNRLTHGAVLARVRQQLSEAPPLAAIDAIALFDSGLAALCDVTVAVTAPRQMRVQRLMAREGISREYACNRIDAQPSDAHFSALCDYTLTNDAGKEAFFTKCIAFFRQLGIIE